MRTSVPDPAPRSLEQARALDAAGRREAAVDAYREHLGSSPEDVEAWVELGGLLLVLGRADDAADACAEALDRDPRNYGAQVHAASAHMQRGDLAFAEEAFQAAIALEPQRLSGRLMLADCLLRMNDLDRAQEVLEGILAQAPDHPAAGERMGVLRVLRRDWPGLRRDLERQLARYTGAEAEYVGSHIDLLLGDMASGWRRFEARLDIPGRHPDRPAHTRPRWRGEPFPGRTLLLTWEQGLGDTLMFLRFAGAARARGGRVVVEVQPALAELARTCAGVDAIVPSGAPLPPYDLHASLLSLPFLLGLGAEDLAGDVPYLRPPSWVPDRAAITDLLQASEGKVRIGLCWAGNPGHPRDAQRSLPPAALAPLAALPHVAWHSFQFGAGEAPPLPGLILPGPLLEGFSNTALALSGMDLVITVDTVVVHLAGSLGLPTFLLASFLPDWRWMLERSDSPWYPTVRIYRQRAPGDWGSAVSDLLRDLAEEATPR